MSQALLKFNLPDDQKEFAMASSGSQAYCVLWDLDQFLRSAIKYEDMNELQVVRDKLTEAMGAYGISFDNM
jgi:hypothetical protein